MGRNGSKGNRLVVDGGVVTNVSAIRVGDSSSAVGNGLVVTNGGYVKASTTYVAGYYGGNSNYVIVTGADSAGRPATLEGNLCLVGTSASGVGNWVRVGAGGLVQRQDYSAT